MIVCNCVRESRLPPGHLQMKKPGLERGPGFFFSAPLVAAVYEEYSGVFRSRCPDDGGAGRSSTEVARSVPVPAPEPTTGGMTPCGSTSASGRPIIDCNSAAAVQSGRRISDEDRQAVFAQYRGELLGGKRRAVQIPLDRIATHCLEQLELLPGFDALGENRHPERVAQGRHG